jgi:hypothetical protein
MRNWLVFLVAAAIGCSSEGSSTTTTPRATGTGATGGTGSGTGGAGATSGSGGATGGSGGSTGGSGGSTGGSGGSTGSGGTTGGMGGSTGGTGGATGGAAGSTGGSAGSSDAGPDASGGSSAGDASSRRDATAEEVQSCNNFADAFCSRLQTCSSFVMSVLYGDIATCRQRWVLSCLPNYNGRGTSASATKTNGCAQTLPALACDKFLLGDFGTTCTPSPGTLAQGAACGDDAQCASTFCARAPTSICGTCQPVTQPGSPCVQSSCSVSTNTICPAGATTCVRPKAGMVGDPCVGQEECDVGHQVGCNTATSKQCIALTLSSGTCGANSILNPTSVAVCGAGGTCTLPYMGTCTPFAADGQNCMTGDTGAHCMQPAKCVGGRCVVPDPSTCN